MALPRGASSALLRRASQAALHDGRSNGSTTDAAHEAGPDSPPQAAARPLPGGPGCRRLLVRCMLLLHTALVASLLLSMATSITSRQQRSRQLAQRLLAGAGTEAAASWVPPVNATALRQCREALELPQVGANVAGICCEAVVIAGSRTAVILPAGVFASWPQTLVVLAGERSCRLQRPSLPACSVHQAQVALLFLVKGPFHHETLWRLWFQSAAGLLPADAVAGALCGDASNSSSSSGSLARHHKVLQACGSVADFQQAAANAAGTSAPAAGAAGGQKGRTLLAGPRAAAGPAASRTGTAVDPPTGTAPDGGIPSSGGSVLDHQALFDLYVHPHPDFPGDTWVQVHRWRWGSCSACAADRSQSRRYASCCPAMLLLRLLLLSPAAHCLYCLAGYPPGSLFHGRELPRHERVVTEWGQHSLVDAGGWCLS